MPLITVGTEKVTPSVPPPTELRLLAVPPGWVELLLNKAAMLEALYASRLSALFPAPPLMLSNQMMALLVPLAESESVGPRAPMLLLLLVLAVGAGGCTLPAKVDRSNDHAGLVESAR